MPGGERGLAAHGGVRRQDAQAVDAQALAHRADGIETTAAQGRERAGELDGFGGGQIGDTGAEQHARQHFIFGQRRHRAEPYLRPLRRAFNAQLGGEAVADILCRDGDDRIGRIAALEPDIAAGELEALAGKIIIAAHQLHPAEQFGRGGTAAQPHIGLPFRFDAHAGHHQLAFGGDSQIVQPTRGCHILRCAPAQQPHIFFRHAEHRHIGDGGAAHAIFRLGQFQRARHNAAIFVGRDPDGAAAGGGQIIAAQYGGIGCHHADIHRETAFQRQIDAARTGDIALAGNAGKADQFEPGGVEAGIKAGAGGHRAQQRRFHPQVTRHDAAGNLRIAQRAGKIGRHLGPAAKIQRR